MISHRFESVKNKLLKAKIALEDAVWELTEQVQPFFPDEITLLYQPSDGFVFIREQDSCQDAVLNICMDEVFDNISKNPKHYFENK